MDDVEVGWARPQEDEFALCLMGLPSPYVVIAFPSSDASNLAYLDLRNLTRSEVDRWKSGFRSLLQGFTYGDGRRLILKSPTHTGRIASLLEMFPDARFIHLMRDPYDVFCSTLDMWREMYGVHSFERKTDIESLENRVFETAERIYESFNRSKSLLRENRLCNVLFEDLVRDPTMEIERIYRELDIDGFGQNLAGPLAIHLEQRGHWTVSTYKDDPQMKKRVFDRWGSIFGECGKRKASAGTQLDDANCEPLIDREIGADP